MTNRDSARKQDSTNLAGRLLRAAAVLAWLALGGSAHAQTYYRVTNIGTLDGATSAAVTGINNMGQVVGVSNSTAFVWDAANGMQALPELAIGAEGLRHSGANGINDNGQVVGFSSYRNASNQNAVSPVIWNPTAGTVQDLGTLGGVVGRAFDINNDGTVVGSSRTATAVETGFVWDATNGIQNANTLFGVSTFRAVAVNNNGEVLMKLRTPSGSSAVGNLANGSSTLVNGEDINDSGQVVGAISGGVGGDFRSTPTIWSNGITSILPMLLTDQVNNQLKQGGAIAIAVNNSGQAVGSGILGGANIDYTHPVIWDLNAGTVLNLNDFIDPAAALTITDAAPGRIDINDYGQIAVTNQGLQGYLLDPLAPGTAAKLLTGTNVAGSIFNDNVNADFSEVTGPGGLFYGDPFLSLGDLPAPVGFTPVLDALGRYGFDLQFTGAFNGPVGLSFAGLAAGTHLYHFVNNQWDDLGSTFDGNGRLTASTNSFSPFVFGTPGSGSPSSVPEPSSLALLAFGAIGLLGYRQRRC